LKPEWGQEINRSAHSGLRKFQVDKKC
jgi:hypothetical protein